MLSLLSYLSGFYNLFGCFREDFALHILMPESPKCWGYRRAIRRLALLFFTIFFLLLPTLAFFLPRIYNSPFSVFQVLGLPICTTTTDFMPISPPLEIGCTSSVVKDKQNHSVYVLIMPILDPIVGSINNFCRLSRNVKFFFSFIALTA